MSPIIYRWKRFRFGFFSREESRPHIHIFSSDGRAVAKFWLVPEVEAAYNYGIRGRAWRQICKIVEERRDEFLQAWYDYFG